MRTIAGLARAALGAVALSAALSGCGGGSASGAYATISFDNDPASVHSIVLVNFDYFDITLLPNRIATVDVGRARARGSTSTSTRPRTSSRSPSRGTT